MHRYQIWYYVLIYLFLKKNNLTSGTTWYQRWEQIIVLQITSRSQVLAFKSPGKSHIKTGKSQVKTDIIQVKVQVFNLKVWVLNKS